MSGGKILWGALGVLILIVFAWIFGCGQTSTFDPWGPPKTPEAQVIERIEIGIGN